MEKVCNSNNGSMLALNGWVEAVHKDGKAEAADGLSQLDWLQSMLEYMQAKHIPPGYASGIIQVGIVTASAISWQVWSAAQLQNIST